MAEARNAIDLYYLQKQGFQITGVEDGYYTLSIALPYPSTFLQAIRVNFNDSLRFIRNRLWPASLSTVLAVMAGVSAVTVSAPKSSWFRSGQVANSIWRLDGLINKFNPIHDSLAVEFRVGYLAASAAFFGMVTIITLERFLLRLLLTNQSWLYVKPRTKLPLTIKLWGGMLKLLSGSTDLTYSFSYSLPTLPVPSLRHTIKCYLDSVKPLMTKEEYQQTKKVAKEFYQGQGRKLQLYLCYKWITTRNYVANWWEKYVYLRGRTPLAVNSNYYITDSKFRPTTDQIERASHVAHHFLKFKDKIESQTLKPILIKGMIPLCMDQYTRMFGTSRVPGREFDKIVHHESSRHVAVLYRGEYFRINVYHGARGTTLVPYSIEEIKAQLKEIMAYVDKLRSTSSASGNNTGTRFVGKSNQRFQTHKIQSYSDLTLLKEQNTQNLTGDNRQSPPLVSFEGSGLAALTAGPRSNWAEIREVYFSRGINKSSLFEIESAAFLIVLESDSGTTLTGRGRSLFTGNGFNRFFDKSLSLIVFKDGYVGMNTEHSWADAPVVAHLWEYALLEELKEYQCKIKPNQTIGSTKARASVLNLSALEVIEGIDERKKSAETNGGNARPVRLIFDVDAQLERSIQQAGIFAKSLINDVDLEIMEFKAFGAGFMKKNGLSPDAFVQMALQLAYFRQHNQFDLTYESSMTRLFRYGRTETIRVLSNESMAWVESMEKSKTLFAGQNSPDLSSIDENSRIVTEEPAFSKEEIIALLKKAASHHSLLSKDSMVGKGIDRHLFALYITSRGFDMDCKFLNDALSIPWRLSTSQQPQQQTDLRKYLHPDIAKCFVSPGGGFGPVADDGYGVSYMIVSNDQVFFHVSSKFSAEKTSSSKFVKSIRQALIDMKELFSSVEV